ncbi:hypothetical protein [Mesorhizobium sp.]|nr:hypothetical protein [Mesorhizobium sp.]
MRLARAGATDQDNIALIGNQGAAALGICRQSGDQFAGFVAA